ncbi:MAG TPA: hypothetical protein PKL34_04565, partial [Candidatus Cloacimonadota bacterium]|nr:hypothetical protein [Candidatus Cloacimonadota bacterium]
MKIKYNTRSQRQRTKWMLMISASLILLLSGCEINRLNRAVDLYDAQNYAGAITELDDLIKSGKNGAIVTRA